MMQWFVNYWYKLITIYSRFTSLLRNWGEAAVVAVRERRFGKLFSWAFISTLLYTAGDFIKLGVTQTLDLLRGIAGSSSLLQGGNLLSWVSQSLSPVEQHASQMVPAFWRWLGWWIGLDWILWAFICSLILAFCGWILSMLIKAVASILRLVFQFI